MLPGVDSLLWGRMRAILCKVNDALDGNERAKSIVYSYEPVLHGNNGVMGRLYSIGNGGAVAGGQGAVDLCGYDRQVRRKDQVSERKALVISEAMRIVSRDIAECVAYPFHGPRFIIATPIGKAPQVSDQPP